MPSGRPSRDSACSSVHSRSCPKAGSQAMQRGCSRPTDGVMIDWCAPPSGASVTPDGVPTRIDCAAGVDAERPRLQRAVDERVVDRADRQQRLAVARPRRARARRAARRGCPRRSRARCAGRARSRASARACRCRRRTSRCARRGARSPTRLIQPPRLVEEATSGLTVTTCAATSGALVGEVDEEAPERLLGRRRARVVAPERRPAPRGGGRGVELGSRARRSAAARGTASASGEPSAKRAHGSSASAPSVGGELLPLLGASAARSGWPGGPRSAAARP